LSFTDASNKNNVASSIVYIYFFKNLLKKMLYHTINIISTEAELFSIRYRINQAIQMQEVSHIIVITNIVYIAKKIFDSSMHPYHQQSIAISNELRVFFNKHEDNTIAT